MKFRIGMFDDEPVFLQDLTRMVESVMEREGFSCRLDGFKRAEELLQAVETGREKYHVLLLDIMAEGLDGLSLAKRLRSAGSDCAIIFITSYPSFALPSFDVAPVHYLLKPVEAHALTEALKRCLPSREKQPVLVLYDAKKSRHVVPFHEILYLEVMRTLLTAHIQDGTEATGIGALSDICKQIPVDCFYQCHRSYVVNLEHVTGIRRYEFLLRNGRTVPIAKNRYNEAMRAMMNFIQADGLYGAGCVRSCCEDKSLSFLREK